MALLLRRMNAVGSGTTALVVVVHKFKLWCAWCGDCGAVLGRRKLKPGTNPGDKTAVAIAAQGGGSLNEDGEDDHFDVSAVCFCLRAGTGSILLLSLYH